MRQVDKRWRRDERRCNKRGRTKQLAGQTREDQEADKRQGRWRTFVAVPLPERGGTQPAELRVSICAIAPQLFCGKLGDGDGCGVIFSISYRRYVMKKLRLNFHLLLPYVVPLNKALFGHNFQKGKGGLWCIYSAFQSANALRTLHRHWFSCWLHWGGNG